MRFSTAFFAPNHRIFLNISMLMLTLFLAISPLLSKGVIIPTDDNQEDFLKMYKLIFAESSIDYRFTNSSIDTLLFPAFGEHSVYWVTSGDNKGSFILPENVTSSYASVTNSEFDSYNWQNEDHTSIQFKSSWIRIAILKSNILKNNKTVNWEHIYFKTAFDSYLYDYIYHFLSEEEIADDGISSSTKLLIIPAFTVEGDDHKKYIDSIFALDNDFKTNIETFLSRGGTIYAEGNAVYFIEKLGYLSNGAVQFNNLDKTDQNTSMMKLDYQNSDNPIAFTEYAAGDSLYSADIPKTTLPNGADIIAKTASKNYPAVFVLENDLANNGRIICNLALPTVGGVNALKNDGEDLHKRQIQWTFNSILYGFASPLDLTRSIWNDLPDSISAGKNAVSYDRVDTFEVRIKVRNLSDETISDIQITETLRRIKIGNSYHHFFDFVGMQTPDIDYSINDYYLRIENLSIPAHTEKEIVYLLRTANPDDEVHEHIDEFINWSTYTYASSNTTRYADSHGKHFFWKWRNYVDLMFSAKIVADTDLNWKNFLGLYYQPFKVFMIMENKERTQAVETEYVQYIPKDVPFYWTDKSINIPILKTPGGKYVDVLKGSNDENNPEYDMDGDGHPDVWLDTASIYPKGYTITEEEVYWLNPWEHLRTGDTLYYEDIDHDGLRPFDVNGDGIVDIEEPGDKIRVWKVTWDIGTVSGYEYFDPYCSYEIWVDPPDLVKLAAGVGMAYGLLDEPVNGMFYPNADNPALADLQDTSWTHWMERNENGDILWKQLIYQRINNYEGFTFIDTAESNYTLLGTDRCAGTAPQPHREFIAVLSLGGEEIDMEHPTPSQSRYSNIKYKTIFNESRNTPIRTTYTYYAPLPNPLQFEYLTNTYTITDDEGDTLKFLPTNGEANLIFDIDASTEYTYYWIRNAGHDVDYNDPSSMIEGVERLGDGVFGYMIYDIPKGMGGYKITLPTNEDGSYDIDSILKVDDGPFQRWLDNPNTKNQVEIWEDQFQYHVYIPQLLIPPALDDDNFDSIDDWIDDRGDRFCSSTGFLHDGFMLDNGEQWLDYPEEPFIDDIYGRVDSGWYHGPDMTYGDDFFETLGKVNFKINARYHGEGKEGPVQISKGGWLVVEEIFGGSPWVIFSHTLSGYSKGMDLVVESKSNPSLVKYGKDTTYMKHKIYDENEPHDFDIRFDPYHVSYGYGDCTITTYAGGQDPCSLIEPTLVTTTIIDPDRQDLDITLIPLAEDSENPDLEDYPKYESGVFLEIRIEVVNGSDDNWLFTQIQPQLSSELGNTEVVMSYVAYPRPLVPAKVDPQTGDIIQGGDDIGTFRTGWRFNQPEGEVLVKMGNQLNLIQPTRRAYFIYLLKIDEDLDKGVYEVPFTMSGESRYYNNASGPDLNYEIPSAYFSIAERDNSFNVVEYQQLVIGQADLSELRTETKDSYTSLKRARWSDQNVNHTDFTDMSNNLTVNYDLETGDEIIDLSSFTDFPSVELNEIYILSKGEVNSLDASDEVEISTKEILEYNYEPWGSFEVEAAKVTVDPIGPKLKPYKQVTKINNTQIRVKADDIPLSWDKQDYFNIETLVEITNYGNDIAENTTLQIKPGKNFKVLTDKLPANCSYSNGKITANLGVALPGETKKLYIPMTSADDACSKMYIETTEISDIEIDYRGSAFPEVFSYADTASLYFPARDIMIESFVCDRQVLVYGEEARFTATIQNGIYPSEDVSLSLFGIFNRSDTVEIERHTFASIDILEMKEHTFEYVIPDTLAHVEFFASIDRDGDICEFCDNNNEMSLVLPIDVPMTVIACEDAVICQDSCALLTAEVIGGIEPYTIKWYPESGLSDPDKIETEVCLRTVGEHQYILTVTDANNYVKAMDTVIVRVRFTPSLGSQYDEYDMGELEACKSSIDKEVILINNGGDEIYIDSIFIDNEDFYYIEPALPIVIPSENTKNITIRYAPTQEGESIGSITFFGGPCLVTHSIGLRGEKMEMLLSTMPSVVDFGNTLCESIIKDTTIIMQNKGTDDILLEFSKANIRVPFKLISPIDNVTLKANETLEISLRYEAINTGEFSSALKVPYKTGNCTDEARISLMAKHSVPSLITSVKSIRYPALLGCESSIDTTIQVLNSGNTDLIITSYEPSDEFDLDVPFIIKPDEIKDIIITFIPEKNGEYSGELQLFSEPCGLVNIISISGEKQGVAFSINDSLSLGELIYCREKTLSNTFSITNNSDGDNIGEVISLNITGPFSTDLSVGDVLPVGEEKEFTVSFNPYSDMLDGVKSGRIDILLSPCNIIKSIHLKAEKYDASFIAGDDLDLGLLSSGESAEGVITFTNSGSTEILITELSSIDKPFEIVKTIPDLPARIDPNDFVEVTVRYTAEKKGEFTSDITAYCEEPCPMSASANVTGVCKTVAETHIAVGSIQGEVGSEVTIPVILQSAENMISSGISSFNIKLSMNASLLKPIKDTPNGIIEDGVRYITYENIHFDGKEGNLIGLDFLAVLGDNECSEITIEEFSWFGGEYDLETTSGEFCLTGLCEEGGKRLFIATNPIYLYECTPNPVKSEVEFRFEVIEKAPTELFIIDLMGNKVETIYKGIPNQGEYSVKYNSDKLQSGAYIYVLQTPSHNLSRQMTIVR